MQPVSMNSVVSIPAGKISSDVADEVMVLDLDKSEYFGFNAVGARIWALMQQPTSVGEIHRTIIAEYDVDGKRCEQDLLRLLNELVVNGLINIHHEISA